MPFSTIDRSSDYFRIKLYTGNGSTQSITFDESKAMQPDCTWIKVRNDANVTLVHDVIRGATKEIYTPLTNAEATDANGLTAFNSNGFSVGSAFGVNRSGYNFVNWSWKANGAGVSNTAGSISSTVSANTTSGFSIVSYTGNGTSGATIGHGLGVVPKMFIIKERTDVNPWVVYHASVDVTGDFTLRLNETSAKANGNNTNNDTAPTSSLITLGTSSLTNGSSKTYIAYCFAEVKGFSKFGGYTGNGSTDGTFVYTGFKPAFVMIKTTSAAESWNIGDNKRNITYPAGANVNNAELYANLSNAETDRSTRGGGVTQFDMLSNGFKCRGANPDINYSGYNYIYMAFAENPFCSSKGIACTAR